MIAETDKIEVGDVVQLNSGGPKMTVDTVDLVEVGEDKVSCTWFDGCGRVKRELFPPACLKPLEK